MLNYIKFKYVEELNVIVSIKRLSNRKTAFVKMYLGEFVHVFMTT